MNMGHFFKWHDRETRVLYNIFLRVLVQLGGIKKLKLMESFELRKIVVVCI